MSTALRPQVVDKNIYTHHELKDIKDYDTGVPNGIYKLICLYLSHVPINGYGDGPFYHAHQWIWQQSLLPCLSMDMVTVHFTMPTN